MSDDVETELRRTLATNAQMARAGCDSSLCRHPLRKRGGQHTNGPCRCERDAGLKPLLAYAALGTAALEIVQRWAAAIVARDAATHTLDNTASGSPAWRAARDRLHAANAEEDACEAAAMVLASRVAPGAP